MKQVQNKSLGFTLTVSVPESPDEYDTLAGKVGACVEAANQFELFHGWNSKFRAKFVEEFEKQTAIKRTVDQAKTDAGTARKDGTKAEVYEKDTLYLKRAYAQLGKTEADFTALASSVAASLPFDPKASSGGRIRSEFLEKAQSVLASEATAPGTIAKVIGNLERLNPGLKVTVDSTTGLPSESDLALAIKVNADRKLAEANAELAA